MARPSGRLWLSAILSWLAMLAGITVAAGTAWVANGPQDPDVHRWTQFLVLVVVGTSIPMFLIAVVVFLPLMLAFERVGGWRSSRLVNGVVGAALALPAVAVIAAVTALLGWHTRGPVSLRWVLLLAFGGLVFGLTTPTSRTALTNPPHPTNPTN